MKKETIPNSADTEEKIKQNCELLINKYTRKIQLPETEKHNLTKTDSSIST